MELTCEDKSIQLAPSPDALEVKYKEIFTLDALEFLTTFISHFQPKAAKLQLARKERKLNLDLNESLPEFRAGATSLAIREGEWKISPLPAKLQNRHIDLGDVSPSNEAHLEMALKSGVQGVQIDFDDGECPSWANIIQGIHNVVAFVRGNFHADAVPDLSSAPILMLRPRAWNMPEHNVMVNGRECPGPLLDFGLLMFHCGKILTDKNVGPYFYLSKVESATEAHLWNEIFLWTQLKLGIPRGTIKACVLIENILAVFEMDEILYELREHSLGLNCGIWDYAASIVTKFGNRSNFLLPDRSTYVNIQNHFLLNYIRLLVKTCHKHEAPATGGMAALTTALCKDQADNIRVEELVWNAKLREIEEGLDGFLIYDPALLPTMNELWAKFGINQIESVRHENLIVQSDDLLKIPGGEVTTAGVLRNIKVSVFYIYSWLANSKGHFELDGGIEDSATAEISRSQIWQYIFHQTKLADGTGETITKSWVMAEAFKLLASTTNGSVYDDKKILGDSIQIFLEIVTASEFPEFLTTYLYNHSIFRALHKT